MQEILVFGDAGFLPALDFALHFPQFVSQSREFFMSIIRPELIGPMCDKVIHIGSRPIPLLFYCSVFGLFQIGYHFQLSSYIQQSVSCFFNPPQLNALAQPKLALLLYVLYFLLWMETVSLVKRTAELIQHLELYLPLTILIFFIHTIANSLGQALRIPTKHRLPLMRKELLYLNLSILDRLFK